MHLIDLIDTLRDDIDDNDEINEVDEYFSDSDIQGNSQLTNTRTKNQSQYNDVNSKRRRDAVPPQNLQVQNQSSNQPDLEDIIRLVTARMQQSGLSTSNDISKHIYIHISSNKIS